MDLRKKVRKVGVAPLSTNRLAETGPKKLGRGARKEDVVSVLHRAAQGAKPISRSVTLEDFDPEGRRLRIHCHRKIRIFRGRRMSHIRLNGFGAVDGAMTAYKDFVEKRPDGSRCQEMASWSS